MTNSEVPCIWSLDRSMLTAHRLCRVGGGHGAPEADGDARRVSRPDARRRVDPRLHDGGRQGVLPALHDAVQVPRRQWLLPRRRVRVRRQALGEDQALLLREYSRTPQLKMAHIWTGRFISQAFQYEMSEKSKTSFLGRS